MKPIRFALILVLLTFASTASAQTGVSAADAAAIKQTALDYIEGWYEGNAERMERALHPELAKRIVQTNPQNNRSRLDQMSAMSLVQGTRRGGGKDTPKERHFPKCSEREGCGLRLDRLPARCEVQWALGDRQRVVGTQTQTITVGAALRGRPRLERVRQSRDL
jgi:hypothetical protein